MELEQQQAFEIRGPQLEILGEVETKLPAPARRRPVAAFVLAVCMLLSVFGIGGARLKGQHDALLREFAATNSYNQGIQNDFVAQTDAAASYIRIAENQLGAGHDAVQAAQQALDNWNAQHNAREPGLEYALNQALYHALTELHQVANGREDDRLAGLYATFTSAQATIDRAGAAWNDQARAYNKTVSGFPAGLVAGVWGVNGIPLFAGSTAATTDNQAHAAGTEHHAGH